MKKYFIALGFIALFFVTGQVEAKRLALVDGLLGDGTSGTSRYLDMIHSGSSNLAHGDHAIFMESGTSYFVPWQYDSGATGSNNITSHQMTIVPYDDPATGLWTEQMPAYLCDGKSGGSIYAANAHFSAVTPTVIYDESVDTGASSEVLKRTATGIIWTNDESGSTGGGTPGGDYSSIQVNNAGAFGGTSIFQDSGGNIWVETSGATILQITPGGMLYTKDASGNTTFSIGIGTSSGNSPYMRGVLNLSSGKDNVIIGPALTGSTIKNAGNNVVLGKGAGIALTTGQRNYLAGLDCGAGMTSGADNMCMGNAAGYGLTTGYENVVIGRNTGSKIGAGIRNVYIGPNCGFSNTGSRNIYIGNEVGYSIIGSDKLFIDNSSTDAPLIYGDFANDRLKFGGGTTTFVGNEKVGVEGGVSAFYYEMAGGVSHFQSGGEAYVSDATGTDTLLSPHDENDDWEFFSRNRKTGEVVRIPMMTVIREVEKLSGKKLIFSDLGSHKLN